MPPQSNTTGKKSTPSKQQQKTSGLDWKYIFIRSAVLVFFILFAWTFYLNARVSTEFQGQLFAEPARVYARPLTLYQGLNLSKQELIFELKRLGYRVSSLPTTEGEYQSSGTSIELVTRSYHHWDGYQESRHLWIDFTQGRIYGIQDIREGSLSLVRLDPLLIGSLFPGHKQDRQLLSVNQVPDLFKKALLAVEDRNFYSHLGISPVGIIRAMVSNIGSGRFTQGGSTLTQQLVKNYFLSRERSLWRKVNEAIMALLLEWHFTKDQILEAYMNEVFLTQDGARAIHGFGLASMELFGAPINELNISQQALLIGMIKGPSLYNPHRNPERAIDRRNLVLGIMLEQQVISTQAYNDAITEPLGIRKDTSRVRYPAFLNLVRRQLQELYRSEDLAEDGLIIYSSLDPRVQSHTENSVIARLRQLELAKGIDDNSLQTAVIVTQPESGEVLAIVGDRNPREAGFNRALDANRAVGSLLKPAIYLTALEQGYTLATPVSDELVVVEGKDGSRWEPQNFDKVSHGQPLLIQALSNSYNQAAARLGMELGLDKVISRMNSLGLKKKLPLFPSILLGSEEFTPMDIANMYGTYAANGMYTPTRSIRAVTNSQHEILNTYDMSFSAVVEPLPMYLLQHGLQQVMSHGTGRYATNRLGGDINMAGKTGTTDDQRDSWFAGYTSDYLAVVWIGRDDNLMTPLTGSSGALRLWTDIMALIKPEPYLSREPANLSWHWIDAGNGTMSKEHCPSSVLLPFAIGTEPNNSPGCEGGASDVKSGWWQRLFNR